MGKEEIKLLLARFSNLRNERSPLEKHWDDIATLVLPLYGGTVGGLDQGSSKSGKLHDSTAPLALLKFISILDGFLTPHGKRWHRLSAPNGEVSTSDDDRKKFTNIEDLLFKYRYNGDSNFSQQMGEAYASLGAFGNTIMYVGSAKKGGIFYRTYSIKDCYVVMTPEDKLETVFRTFKFSATQAFSTWGNAVSEKIKNALARSPEEKFEFLHVVTPNPNIKKSEGVEGKRYTSYYIEVQGEVVLEIGGYNVMPYAFGRYSVAPNEVWGRGPGSLVFPDIRIINEMELISLKASQKLLNPPLLASSILTVGKLKLTPGGVNYGSVDSNGRPLVTELGSKSQVELSEHKLATKREVVKDAFLVKMFRMLEDLPQKTATEVFEIVREKGHLIGSVVYRLQGEFFSSLISREIDILMNSGKLEDLPSSIEEEDGLLKISYENSINRAVYNEDVTSFERVMTSVQLFLERDPDLARIYDVEGIIRYLHKKHNVPVEFLKSKEVYSKEMEALGEQRESQNALEQLRTVSEGVRNVGGAEGVDNLVKNVGS
jgi:hypothetical protein